MIIFVVSCPVKKDVGILQDKEVNRNETPEIDLCNAKLLSLQSYMNDISIQLHQPYLNLIQHRLTLTREKIRILSKRAKMILKSKVNKFLSLLLIDHKVMLLFWINTPPMIILVMFRINVNRLFLVLLKRAHMWLVLHWFVAWVTSFVRLGHRLPVIRSQVVWYLI